MPVCAACGHVSAEPFRFCPECGAAAADTAPEREQRRVVTILFCDVTGSTAMGESLDAEALRALLARYFEAMKAIVERHGGTVEKFIGDAVMAVFGVPRLHEDDALRAARAAVEMRDALPGLGVQGRIGLATGEVVTGTAERLATGDAVNLAARLQQAAQPGEVLAAGSTLALVRDAVEADTVEPLSVRGKAAPVEAARLVAVVERPRASDLEGKLVGRERQLHLLQEVFSGTVADRSCTLVTVLGAAGVGKSRLVREFLAGVEAPVVRGRCLSYGEGITYWPVVEILQELGSRPQDDAAAAAVAAVMGESDEPVTPGEIAWGVRKALEHAAEAGPLVCVLDDLHWAEPGLLDLVEHVADFSRDAPILLLCIARPELLERRQGWGGGKMNAVTILLEPLTAEQTDEMIAGLGHVEPALRARILEAAEGNPLFVEEMLAMVRESPGRDLAVPPTIQALLAARLDHLDGAERAILERGAVEGKVFHRGAVTALAPEEPRVTDRLMGLVRKELVRPDRTQIAGDDAFRFRHLLIRDAAYDGLPKAVRADLHHRFADWLSANGGDLVELDEIVGYHLEQACRYRDELGLEHAPATAAAARERLKAAGRRALMREDLDAGTNLFQRSVSVDPASATDLGLHLDLAESLFERGQAADALRHLQAVEAQRAAAGDRVGQLTVRIMRHRILLYVEPEGAAARLAALAQDALPELEAAGSDLGLYVAHLALGDAANIGAHTDVQARELQEAMEYARRFGQPHLLRQLDRESGAARLFGRTPADEILAWADDVAARRGRLLFMAAGARAVALAMQGYSDEARSLLDAVRERLSEQGADIAYALATGQIAPWIERLAGNRDRAAELGLEGSRLLEAAGERGWLSTTVGYRSVILAHLGQLEEAEAEARRAAAFGSSDDAITQMLALQARGIVLAHRGGHEEAERLAREAVAIGTTTDHIDGQADAWADLGTVLELAGRPAEAAAALERAAELYAAKGNVVCQERARTGIARLGAAPTP